MAGGWNGEAIVSAVAIIVSLYTMRHGDQKDRKALEETQKIEREKVIQAIKDRDSRLTYILQENIPHFHTETGDECLKAEGIKYTKIRLNGEN